MTLSNGPGPEAIVARVTNAWRSARGGKDVKIEGKMRGGKERSGSILRAFSGGSDPPRRGGTGSWGWGGGGGGGDGGDGGGERGMAVLGRNELGALGYAQVRCCVKQFMAVRIGDGDGMGGENRPCLQYCIRSVQQVVFF